MDENIFNLSKEYNRVCRYWDFGNKYRLYASGFSTYNEYSSLQEIIFAFYAANSKTNFANPSHHQFNYLTLKEAKSLNIADFGVSNKLVFEKYFFTLYNMYNGTCSSSNITEIIKSSDDIIIAGPCSVCGMIDKWNSISNSKNYCYLHCKY